MNTTFGLGGLVDLATREGDPQQTGDFGQTLFVWGVGEGPYMVRPYWAPRRREMRWVTSSIALAIRSGCCIDHSWSLQLPQRAWTRSSGSAS